MNGHGEKLTRKQEQAIAALLTAPTVAAAAEQLGIGVATLLRWQQLPAFGEAYRLARRDVVSQATGKLSAACTEAVATLCEIMTDKSNSATARVAAAKSILDFSYKALELEDLAARVDALEGHVKGGQS